MLFNFVDILQNKRRLLYVALFVSIDFLLLSLGSQTLQAHRSNFTTRIHNSEITAAEPNYTGELSTDIERSVSRFEAQTLRATVAVTDGMAKAERATQHATAATLHAIGTGTMATLHGIGAALTFTGHVIIFPFVAIGHGAGHIFGTASGLTPSNLASVIQPEGNKDVPVITREQAQQASLIQKDTVAVTPVKPTGSGGACDSGAGNGGYPMEWCDARMDSIRTVAYSGDRINRECTSYAYWYFTTIEGHTDFHVTGNANRWAYTSNYPTHAAPAVGSIAVETAGIYGHVAIVQALPGETYENQVVPAGYVLVSEMNYDWQGHFRYSYSPLSKFSAYIYP